MAVPFRADSLRSWLRVEHLEDRTTPTAVLTENFGRFAADRVIVTLDSVADAPAVTASPLTESAQRLGGATYLVHLNDGVTVGQALTVFSGTAGVRSAEADFEIGVRLVPNDPSFGSLWGLNNSNDSDIDAPEAWDVARGNRTTIVAVIDTGVLWNHPDLAANMWVNNDIAGNGVDDDSNGYVDDVYGWDFANNDSNPMDDNGHGTHVAGTIGAVGNNGVGVTGVAWTTQIMALKFLTASGSGSTSGAVSAIYYAVDNGAKILNNSWGGGGYSQALFNAISYANTNGVIFVAAAGNSASNNDTTANYPSNYALPNVVAVASTTSSGGLSSFSSYGATTVDVGAPGSNVYSTYLNNGYATLSGTSMATPHVSGALAVYWDANGGKTAAEVIQRLKDTVDPLASLAGKTVTGGQLNLNKMLTGSSPPPPAFDSGARVTAAGFSGATSNTLDTVRLTFSEAVNASSFTFADDITLTGPGGAIAGTLTQVNATTFDVTFASQSAFGTYTVTVGPNVLDLAGNPMNQDNDQTNGEATADRYTGSATLSPPYQTFTYTSNTAMSIRDRSTQTAALTVPPVSGVTNVPLSDLNVRVNLTHTYTDDLRLTLIAPNGTRVQLFNRRGGSGDNLTSTTFNDEATTAIAVGAAPFSGSFRPEQVLSALDGLSATGTWRLEIADLARGDIGTLLNWSLIFTTGTAPGGQGVQSYAFFDADLNAPTEFKPQLDSDLPVVVTVTAPTVAPPAAAAPASSPTPAQQVEIAEAVEQLVESGAALPTGGPVTITLSDGTAFTVTVDLLSFLSLFHDEKDDVFGPILL